MSPNFRTRHLDGQNVPSELISSPGNFGIKRFKKLRHLSINQKEIQYSLTKKYSVVLRHCS